MRLENPPPPPPPNNFSNGLSLNRVGQDPAEEHPFTIFTSLLAAHIIVFHSCSIRHNRTSYTVKRIEGK